MHIKKIPLLVGFALILAACSSSEEATVNLVDEETASSCFDLIDDAAVSDLSGNTLGYEVDTENPPPIEVIDSEESDYSNVDYNLDPISLGLLDDDLGNSAFPKAVIDANDILSGGVGIDGIPPIDQPEFAAIKDIDFIQSCAEPVVSVDVNGDTRAFPISVLIRHEIVNTEVGGVPVSVTYCPLCNSALAFDRRVGTELLDFGVSGRLYNSALLMYDRQTGSLWSHFTGEGVIGHYAGLKLPLIPAQTVSYGEFVKANPDGQVLTDKNEHTDGGYGTNGYLGYDTSDDPFLFDGELDERLGRKERVVGLTLGGDAIAVPFEQLQAAKVIEIDSEEPGIVVFFADGLASPVDSRVIADGRDVGQSGVFIASTGETPLTFKPGAITGEFLDNETGSTWNIFGEGIDGELKGERLEPISHLDAFWFAWAAYRPDTQIFEATS